MVRRVFLHVAVGTIFAVLFPPPPPPTRPLPMARGAFNPLLLQETRSRRREPILPVCVDRRARESAAAALELARRLALFLLLLFPSLFSLSPP